jgi:hypothetical protein
LPFSLGSVPKKITLLLDIYYRTIAYGSHTPLISNPESSPLFWEEESWPLIEKMMLDKENCLSTADEIDEQDSDSKPEGSFSLAESRADQAWLQGPQECRWPLNCAGFSKR